MGITIGLKRLTRTVAAFAALACLAVAADRPADGRPSRMIRFRKGEHPRIWITREDLPSIRKRCAPGGSHEREFKRLKALVDLQMTRHDLAGPEHLKNPTHVAFVYLITGERKYAEQTKKMLKVIPRGRPAFRTAGVALDWVMAKSDIDTAEGVPVTRGEFDELVHALTSTGGRWQLKVEHYQGNYHFPYANGIFHHPYEKPWQYRQPAMFYFALAVHNEGEAVTTYDAALDWIMRWAREEWIPAGNRWPRGTHYPGFLQYYNYQFGSEARVAKAWKVATGEDLFGGSVQLREFPRWGFYQREPASGEWVSFSDGRRGVNADSIMPIYSHANTDPAVRALAQYVENRRLTDESFWKKPVEDGGTLRATWELWERILWYDPKAPQADPKTTPTAAYFPGNGCSSLRSGWGRDATAFFFLAGDHVNHHQLSNQGNFEIFRKGHLASSSALQESTIGGNCLLVHDPEEIFYSGWGNLKAHPNDGGQYLFEHGKLYTGGDWRKRRKDDVYDVAQTTAFASQPLYDYVAADLTNAYRREFKDQVVLKGHPAAKMNFKPTNRKNKLTRCTRQIVFLKPDIFVMFDRVDSTDAQFRKTWLLHTPNEPTLDGSLYSAENGRGKLMVRRLLPKEAGVRKLGGDELNAWMRGTEWPKEVAQWHRTRGIAPWRIEEEPTEKRTDDVFLHVLYACDKGMRDMPKCEVLTRANLTGVKVDYLGRVYEVLLRRDGGRECAGHVTVTENGKVLADDALAEKVIPTFDVKPPMPDLR